MKEDILIQDCKFTRRRLHEDFFGSDSELLKQLPRAENEDYVLRSNFLLVSK